MQKIKIIQCRTTFELEEKVNDFIKNKNVKSISYNAFENYTPYACCILYEQISNK